MLVDDGEHWQRCLLHMLNLLRWSSEGGDAEIVQASATHLVFAQADAIRANMANAPAWRGVATDAHVRAMWSRLGRALVSVSGSPRDRPS